MLYKICIQEMRYIWLPKDGEYEVKFSLKFSTVNPHEILQLKYSRVK
jgi:hypothetical protein